MSSRQLRDLTQLFPNAGRLEAIVLRPDRRVQAVHTEQATLQPGFGLVGDRRAQKERIGSSSRKRELTLIQHEHLPLVARLCGKASVDAADLRRNLVVSGINLLAMRSPFKNQVLEYSIGDEAVVQITGLCEPCSRMEEVLGEGGYNAMRGHGGVIAMVLHGGVIRIGDTVRLKSVVEVE